MNDILFRCESRIQYPGPGRLRSELTIHTNGMTEVWRRGEEKRDIFVRPENIYKRVVAPEIANQVRSILQCRETAIKALPNCTNNGTFDGSMDTFWFGEKEVVTWNIKRHNFKSLETKATYFPQKATDYSTYMEKSRKNLLYENTICDIYNEIAEAVNKYAPHFQLPLL